MTAPVAAPAAAPEDVAALWRDAAANKEARINLARRSIAFFARYYLRARGHPVAVPACHLDWYREIGTGDGYHRQPYRQRKRLLLTPRSHGKSFVACWVVVLHRICFNRNVRILLLGAKAEAAQKWLRRVRKQLEQNRLLIEDFGGADGFRDPDAPWSDHRFQVRRTDLSLADATLEAVGAGGAITGGRFDMIIADDPEDDDSVLTPHVRRRTRNWFRTTIQELLEPWGELLCTGTKKHYDDLYSHLEADPTYRTVKRQAIIRWPEGWEFVRDENGTVVDVTVKGESIVLWPELWPIQALLLKRESSSALLFARENQNEVRSDEVAIFKLEDLRLARERGLDMRVWRSSEDVPAGWAVVQAWDPAFVDSPDKAELTDSDYFVGLTVAVNLKTMERRIIGLERWRGAKTEFFLARIRSVAAPFANPSETHPFGCLRFIVVENNSLGKLYEIGLKRETDLPLIPHTTKKGKADPYEGIPAMASLFEGGKISVASMGLDDSVEADRNYKQAVDAFVDEMHGLGVEPHDDTVMALYLAEIAVRSLRRYIERTDLATGRPSPPRRPGKRPGGGPRPTADGGTPVK